MFDFQQTVPILTDIIGGVTKILINDVTMEFSEALMRQPIVSNLTSMSNLLLFLSTLKYTPTLRDNIRDEYDFIVVGCGSAGSTVAGRLSEMPENVSVLCLESGPRPNILTEIPALARIFFDTELDWKLKTVPQKRGAEALDNRQIAFTLGKGIGGCSLWNAMLDVRGNKRNYDDWVNVYGADGWSYKDVLKYFKRAETMREPEFQKYSKYHGFTGPLTKERPTFQSKYKDGVHDAATLAGYKFVDSNAEKQYGFFDHTATIRDGRRCSAPKAYLLPNDWRKNLDIVENAHVMEVLIDKKDKATLTATGVRVKFKGKERIVRSKNEVILSAGAIHTPKILMLSGIGPSQHLREKGIDVKKDLPVGQNFQDHPAAILPYIIPSKHHVQFFFQILNPVNVALYIANGTGPLSSTEGINTLAFLRRTKDIPPNDDGYPATQLIFSESYPIFVQSQINMEKEAYNKFYGPYELQSKMWCIGQVLNPKSHGSIKLQSKNPFDAPLIDPKYYEDEEDFEDAVYAMKQCYEIFSSPVFKALGAKPLETDHFGCGVFENTDRFYRCLVNGITITLAHNVGTARMGRVDDPKAVVNSSLNVIGVEKLRVVDASVMPQVISGNTNVPSIMVAEKAVDIIKKAYGYEIKTHE